LPWAAAHGRDGRDKPGQRGHDSRRQRTTNDSDSAMRLVISVAVLAIAQPAAHNEHQKEEVRKRRAVLSPRVLSSSRSGVSLRVSTVNTGRHISAQAAALLGPVSSNPKARHQWPGYNCCSALPVLVLRALSSNAGRGSAPI
jgi:hypothetical protein